MADINISKLKLPNDNNTYHFKDTVSGYTSNTGTVTSVTAGTGLNGGTISTSGTISVKYGSSSGTACEGNDSRLSNARPASDVSSWAKASTKPSYSASEVGAIATTAKGAASGVAELDANGKVPTSQLPSYVDDVLEYTSKSSFPTTGETGKIYVDTTTNLTYRWSGTAYVEISPSLALGETSSTAYRGDRGKVAYNHSQSTHARTDATAVSFSRNLTSGTKIGTITINGSGTDLYCQTAPTKVSQLTNDSGYITSYVDTKNTAGSTDTSSKIFLVGATSQAANPQTYSDNEVYTTSGVLTTKSVQIGGGAATLQYNSTLNCIDFVFAS